jgi:hypothetical protein
VAGRGAALAAVALLISLTALVVEQSDGTVFQTALGVSVAVLPLATGAAILRSGCTTSTGSSAAAAAFQPARRRIQQAVDRRFNRRRHDAARIIEGFAARLRDQVDLDALHGELLAVVDETMQPTRASLWLRPQAMRSSPRTVA